MLYQKKILTALFALLLIITAGHSNAEENNHENTPLIDSEIRQLLDGLKRTYLEPGLFINREAGYVFP